MPSGFPGPARPRFSLRRLGRSSRYPSTSYTGAQAGRARYDVDGSSLSRRGLIATGALLAAGGATEAIRALVGGSRPRTVGAPRGLGNSLASLIEGHPSAQATKPSALPTITPSATPTHHNSPTHSHGHSHGHGNGSHSHGGHHPQGSHANESKRARARRLRNERVTLPPPQLNVRSSPAYQVSQLIPDAPKHAIALTIDDGPDPLYTPSVLKLLEKYQTQASFCVVGEHAAAYPGLVRDIASAGHIIVNHSYTHLLPFNTLSEKRIVWEITKTQSTIEKVAGVTPQLFRSPGGEWSRFIYQAIAAYGLEPLDWDVDPRDWALPGTNNIVKAMLKARPGEIVLCHDGGGNRSETVKALRKVLPTWQRRGLLTIPLHVTPHYLTDITPTASSSSTSTPTPTATPTT
jgi:peptidoglycan/xylan/chitin deacetylase (PgdA/CDA1 family)